MRAAVVRLVRRRGGVSRIRAMIRRTAASSSGVHAVNALCLSAATSEAIQPSIAWSSRSSPARSVSGRASTASASAAVLAVSVTSSGTGFPASRKNRRNTSS